MMKQILWVALAVAIVVVGMGWIGEARSPTVQEVTVVSSMATRLSVAMDGAPANGGSWLPAISGDGRFVAFHSRAGNLVIGDTNRREDVFVHDRCTRRISRVSVATGGAQGNSYSWGPSISEDGRFIAFTSRAGNLVPGVTKPAWNVFVHDRKTGGTTHVSMASDDLLGNDHSWKPAISADGRHVALTSWTGNVMPGVTYGAAGVFVHEWQPAYTHSLPVSHGRINC
jgi:hypothetical protein